MESFLKEPNRVSLLTIPRSDLKSASPSEALLLQLPLGWKPSDLRSARFVVAGSSTSDSSETVVAEPQQAALVVESKQCSFSCYTVETSNSFILIPPSSNGDDRNNHSKRSKVLESGKTLTPVHARLLKMGGAGASFLELRPKPLRRTDLLAALQQDSVWDPYNDHNNNRPAGHTIEALATRLQLSQGQIRDGLKRIPSAMRRPQSEEEQYVLVAEEALQECYNAIVAALTEVDEFQNYAAGIRIPALLEEALYRMSPEEQFVHADHVLLHCVRQLSNDTTVVGTTEEHARVRLDVTKVAVAVARRLLQTESAEWLDEMTFCEAWQLALPGTAYQIQPDMLRGVAVVKEMVVDATNQPDERRRQLKYLPADKLPMDAQTCLDQLFQVKERWLLQELEPYLDRLTDDGTTVSELLLRFTQTETEDRDGINTKVYRKK